MKLAKNLFGENKRMEQYLWVLWVVIGIGLIIAEIFTLGFVLLWFGIGAIIAAFFGYLGFGIGIQFLAFAITSILLTILSRQIFHNKYLNEPNSEIKTGIDSLPGKVGTVSGASQGSLNAGEVKVFGSIWTAFPEDGEPPLLEGEKVEVIEVKGASIYVRRVRELPEWREG